ncbi:MAG TPA: protoheme IX farnesyltransferase, partial [Roseiflexaceae bacterium]|nr:protoheme IX farnesyltransferase [Roseiflexaceae bacterium]
MLQHLFQRTRTAWPLAILALAAYCVSIAGNLQTSLAGVSTAWVALLVLGGAVALLSVRWIGVVPAQRLGGRAQAARRRYVRLALGTTALVYVVLALGTLVTQSGALWDCTTLPICVDGTQAALLGTVHRGMAGIGTLLVFWLVFATWRIWTSTPMRRVAGLALALIVVQNIVGLVQVVLAGQGAGPGVESARIAHLAVGALTWSALVMLVTLALRVPFPTSSSLAEATTAVPGLTDRALLASK